jgi:hypothetical protein
VAGYRWPADRERIGKLVHGTVTVSQQSQNLAAMRIG